MGYPKWKAICALARASSAAEEPSTYKYIVCESANIVGAPIVAERAPNMEPDVDRQEAGGFDWTFSVEGATVNANLAGYLVWLMLGSESNVADVHTIVPAADAQYLNILIDRGVEIEAAKQAERLIGAKLTNLSLEFTQKEYAKVSFSGSGCTLGATAAALTYSIPTGDNEAPLSWGALMGSGYFNTGFNAGSVTADTNIRGFKIDIARSAVGHGVDLNSNQPTSIASGKRVVTFSYTREFSGTKAMAEYVAWKAQQEIAIDFKALMGTYYLQGQVDAARMTAGLPKELGGDESAILAEASATAFNKDGGGICAFTCKDGDATAYD